MDVKSVPVGRIGSAGERTLFRKSSMGTLLRFTAMHSIANDDLVHLVAADR
jgi:hypothetical protein